MYSAHPSNNAAKEPTDPCYKTAGFTSSVCTMAYRWHLDYVKDVHGNAMAFYYKQDTNFYGEDNGAHNVSYVRDSYLDHIDYGFTDGNAFGTVPNQVVFTPDDRCLNSPCDPLNSTTKQSWPDVPYDLICQSGATCSPYSPSFFSTVRLASITTQQYSTTDSQYHPVNTYTLTQTLPSNNDQTSPTLWLASITQTGSHLNADGSTSAITLPPVTFTSVALANRVDTVTDGLPALYRYRIASVVTETGSVIGVTYGQPNPCTAPVTISPRSEHQFLLPGVRGPRRATPPVSWTGSTSMSSTR